MIQEIYDYLLIRSHFLFDDNMIERCGENDNFKYIVMNISKVMQREDYFILSSSLQKNVSDLIQKYRFDFNKDKVVNDEVNFIIGRLNEYKSISEKRKNEKVNCWLNEEYKVRNLPRKFRVFNNISKAIANEHVLFMKVCGMKLDETGTNYIPVSENEDYMENVDYFDYLQLINLLANRFPTVFYENNFLEITLNNINELLNTQKDRLLLKYIKSTAKNLSGLERDMREVAMELITEKRLIY